MRDRPETVLDLLDRNACEHSGTTATVDGDITVTWSRYLERSRALALGLLGPGVAPGQVVGLRMVNRAEHVMAGRALRHVVVLEPGRLNLPDETARTVDPAGQVHTGDIGEFDDDGCLMITGRTTEMINAAAGKMISPMAVETEPARDSPLIGQVFVHGEDRPCLVASVTLDRDVRSGWCAQRGTEVGSAAEAARHGRVELCRAEIAERYRHEPEQLYAPLAVDSWIGEWPGIHRVPAASKD